MATKIDQKAYLQKYLSGPSKDKKKKKKKVVKGNGFKIIDDDIDLTKLRPLDGDELDIYDEGEDAPQVAGIIDERPEEIRKLEQFKTTSKWKVVSQDDGFNSKLQIEEIKRSVKEQQKENEIVFGKMYSDSEDEKRNDSDLSPARKTCQNNSKKDSKKPQNHSDSDFSPPRKNSTASPSRKTKSNKNYDSDVSPPRKRDVQIPRQRKASRWDNSEEKMQRSRRKSRDSDVSPPRKTRRQSDSDVSPPRKSRRRSDSDASPPRRKDKSPKRRTSPGEVRKNKYKDSDSSPPRKSRKESPSHRSRNSTSPRHRKNRNKSPDSDPSPPRKRNKSPKRNMSPDSDMSPPRKRKSSPHHSKNKRELRQNSDSPPPSNKKMAKTLEGKVAGLQNAQKLREENEAFRRREEEAFKKMSDEVSGRNAQVTSRKSKRETSEERNKQREKAEKQKELEEKYKRWGKGLKQIEAQETRIQEFMHESAKPLARYRSDKDLEDSLKQIEREGDPMLNYIKEKKRERGELGPEKPMYKGNFPPNRYNIRPGYRWDGVDRSNGYEKKYFETQSKKRAEAEEYHKWACEDL